MEEGEKMLTESMEDYLETLFRLTQEKGYIKAVDLAETLKVQPSSVTRMLQKLHREGFIQYHKYRHTELTEKVSAWDTFSSGGTGF